MNSKVRKFVQYLPNLVLALLVVYLLVQRLPSLIERAQREGSVIASTYQLPALNGEMLEVPASKRHLLVFWATWCGPCEVELKRIQRLIDSGAVPAASVIAISVGESREVVEENVNENGYRFTVVLDERSEVAEKFNVRGTPTLLLVGEDRAIKWMTVGISPSLELRLKSFFNY
jgi:thiol-disulfide isomerase/thioredoxin